MRILALQVAGLRNLQPLSLEPGPRFNVFAGDNGQGKTNLIEAIFAVCTLRSFRTAHLVDLVAHGEPAARVSARVERAGLERIYQLALERRRAQVAKVARLDGKAVRPIARYFGEFNVVLFAPEDLAVPRGSPGERRRFLDRAVFNRHAAYLGDAQAYDRVLRSRNALLRDGHGRPPRAELLAVYDEQLCQHGARIVRARAALVAELTPRLAAAYQAITHSGLVAHVRYELRHEPEADAAGFSELELQARLAARLDERRAVDVARGATTVGPHRDDLVFELGGHRAAQTASQGQLRALVLSWKTAEMDLLRDTHGEAPILLLDDVSSELDPQRNEYLFDYLRNRPNQCFITTTHPRHVLLAAERVDFRVVAGGVTRQNES